jgi:hypothetical protein
MQEKVLFGKVVTEIDNCIYDYLENDKRLLKNTVFYSHFLVNNSLYYPCIYPGGQEMIPYGNEYMVEYREDHRYQQQSYSLDTVSRTILRSLYRKRQIDFCDKHPC